MTLRKSERASTRPRNLTGRASDGDPDADVLLLVRQSQRHQRASAGSASSRVRVIAADPHVHALGAVIAESNRREHSVGGRPLTYPDWCLVLFGAAIRIFGSASATASALGDPALWAEILRAADPLIEVDASIPQCGPNRDHWSYFLRKRISTGGLPMISGLMTDLAMERAREVGLLNQDDVQPVGRYHRDHVVGLDGKVFSSPLRTLDRERVNRATGELRPVRQDSARQQYGEGGVDGIVWGTKFAIASVRSPMTNHRVILGISHFDSTTPGGEGRVFADLAKDLAGRSSGIHAFTADGAWRGTHLDQVQAATGCGVIAPTRHLTARKGGITLGRHSFAAQPLPWSSRRSRREAGCNGHQLWACAGTLFEQIIASNGSSDFVELHRHQTKRDVTHHKNGSKRHQFYGRYSLPCPSTGLSHTWWEPLLPVAHDAQARFNRCEYLRVVPATSPEHARLYGMRQDTESLNAQLERAFYGQRLPAWGVHNQTVVVLLAALAENAWARQVWRDELDRQRT